MILLDTHVLIWLDQGNDQLGLETRTRIDAALQDESLGVSAISFWEIGMLKNKNRIHPPPLIPWRRELIEMGINEIPLDGAVGLAANTLVDFHSDPADRLIVATAIENDALLITADSRILKWRGSVNRFDAEQ